MCLTTQHYDVLYSRFSKRIVSTLDLGLGVIRGRKWNAERTIIFHMDILQRVHLVTGAKNICTQIDAQIAAWNYEAFGKLVCDSYTAAMGYLGRAHRNKNVDKCRRTF